MSTEDRYAGLDYRAMIQWSSRLSREWPLYERVFDAVPERALLDLGCGPGEHCARFAVEGWVTCGVDVSATQIETARSEHPGLTFSRVDLAELSTQLDRRYGAAICVGNVLPNLDDHALGAMLKALREHLIAGGILVLQQLEFGPILEGRRRSIGPIFSPIDRAGDEAVFLRIFRPGSDERSVTFHPTRFLLTDDRVNPVRLDRVETVVWRARRVEELRAELLRHDFDPLEVWGGPEMIPHDPTSSPDLWMVARRSGDR
jgi:SAM-dependent methyltransferase